MTDQNNAAQPVLTDDEILTATLYGQSEARMIRNGRAIESALLSKLRAPVADSATVGARHPMVVKWRNSGIEACAGIADAYGMSQAAIDMRAMLTKEIKDESNTALARSTSPDSACDGRGVFLGLRGDSVSGIAPVAGETIGQIVLFGGDLKEVSWRDGKMPPPGTTLYAAPQTSEPVYAYRRKGLDDFVTCDRERFDELSAKPRLFETRIFYAAPQASEAARWNAYAKQFPEVSSAFLSMHDPVSETKK